MKNHYRIPFAVKLHKMSWYPAGEPYNDTTHIQLLQLSHVNHGRRSTENVKRTPLPLPLEVGPLDPARRSGERCKLPQQGLGGAPAAIEFGAF